METILARQPIFDVNRHLFAYELLYRGVELSSLANVGGNHATSTLLTSSFFTEGLEKISGNKPCFVNFTEDLLLENIIERLPVDTIVVEVLEDVQPTSEIIAACRKLKNFGYTIALDDFVYHPKYIPLIELADIIKIDFFLTPVDEIHNTLDYLSPYDIDFLAEKVETVEEFIKARDLGFKYFQGYFFARPEVMRIKELTTSKIILFKLLCEINKKDVSGSEISPCC